MNPIQTPIREEQLLQTITTEYEAGGIPLLFGNRQRPIFSPMMHVPLMLPDARIQFGLAMIRGCIKALTKPELTVSVPGLVDHAVKIINRFMTYGLTKALRCIDWGWSANEVLYSIEDGMLTYQGLKDIQSYDARAVAFKGQFVGATIRNMLAPAMTKDGQPKLFIGGPKLLWSVHRRQCNQFYGQSRMYGAFLPWWEKWSEGGYRDMRRLWYYKNAFRSPTVRHPEGSTKLPSGQIIANKDIARNIGEWMRSGYQLTLPSTKDPQGNFLWEIEDARGNDTPGGLLDYGQDLQFEIFEGMQISEEIVATQSQGLGSGTGRSIPMIMFLSTLQEDVEWVLFDFGKQVLEPILTIINGNKPVYVEIKVPSLVDAFLPNETIQPDGFQDEEETNEEGGDEEATSDTDKEPENNGSEIVEG